MYVCSVFMRVTLLWCVDVWIILARDNNSDVDDIKVSQKFCNTLIGVSLSRIYHVTEALQVWVDICYGWFYCNSWCAEMLCIVSRHI